MPNSYFVTHRGVWRGDALLSTDDRSVLLKECKGKTLGYVVEQLRALYRLPRAITAGAFTTKVRRPAFEEVYHNPAPMVAAWYKHPKNWHEKPRACLTRPEATAKAILDLERKTKFMVEADLALPMPPTRFLILLAAGDMATVYEFVPADAFLCCCCVTM